jgi:hypothetical protein
MGIFSGNIFFNECVPQNPQKALQSKVKSHVTNNGPRGDGRFNIRPKTTLASKVGNT